MKSLLGRVEGLLGSKILQSYIVEGQVQASSGPWLIYKAHSKKSGAIVKDVSIWVLDKKKLVEANKQIARPKQFEPLFEQQRNGYHHMNRIKHPGVIRVVEQLEDLTSQMVFATEVVVGSLHNVLTHFEDLPGAGMDARAMRLSTLEVKIGVVQLVDTLTFLHNDAALVHCGISPQAIMITPDGSWKLAGFAHALASNYAAPAPASNAQYRYDDPFPPACDELTKPSLPYTAPELVGGLGSMQAATGRAITPGADVFSTAVVLFELFSAVDAEGKASTQPRPPSLKAAASNATAGAGEQLLPVRSNLHDYRDRVTALQHRSDHKWHPLLLMPDQLQGLMQSMLAISPSDRPIIGALAANPYFQEDVLLRALRFLDTLLQRDEEEKIIFLRHLATFFFKFDDRILKRRVLPPLIQELEHQALQMELLPILLSMMATCSPAYFMAHLLPMLAPILASAQGELLGKLVVLGSGVLAKLMSQEAAARHLVPMYARGMDSHDYPHVQQECLKVLQANCPVLDLKLLREGILPRVCTVCLATTVGAVRAQCFRFMTCATSRMGPKEVDAVMDTGSQVVAVDHSASTLVRVAHLMDAISSHVGADATATRVLPLLCPLLSMHTLNGRQFKDIMAIVQACLNRITIKMAPDSHMSTPATTFFSNAMAVQTAAAAAAAAAALPVPVAPAATAALPKGVATWDTQVEASRAHQTAKAARPPLAAAPAVALPPASMPSPTQPPPLQPALLRQQQQQTPQQHRLLRPPGWAPPAPAPPSALDPFALSDSYAPQGGIPGHQGSGVAAAPTATSTTAATLGCEGGGGGGGRLQGVGASSASREAENRWGEFGGGGGLSSCSSGLDLGGGGSPGVGGLGSAADAGGMLGSNLSSGIGGGVGGSVGSASSVQGNGWTGSALGAAVMRRRESEGFDPFAAAAPVDGTGTPATASLQQASRQQEHRQAWGSGPGRAPPTTTGVTPTLKPPPPSSGFDLLS